MDNHLAEISSIYRQYTMRSPKFTQILVNAPLFNTMNALLFKIRQELGSNLTHYNISLIDYEIKSMLFTYGTSLIPISQSCTESHFTYLTKQLEALFLPFMSKPEMLEKFIQLYTQLFEYPKHPFQAALNDIISFSSSKYAIVTKRMLPAEIIHQVQRQYQNYTIEFLTYTDYSKTIKPFDNVIFIGSPRLFNDNILQHINANHFYFVLFDCYYSELKHVQWIEHARIIKNADVPTIQKRVISYDFPIVKTEVEQALPEIDAIPETFTFEEPAILDTLIDFYLKNNVSKEKDKLFKCKLLELEGNRFFFEDIGPKAKCDIITTEFLYERKHLDYVSPNEYLILIDFYRWDDRRKLADQYFEQKGILKDRQTIAKLKKFLNSQIETYGAEKYTKMLNRKLNLNLKEYQITGLTKKESFQLKDKKVFYTLLKHITKTEALANKYLKACLNLANYHNRVGRIARKGLRDYLDANPEILENIDTLSHIQIPTMEFLKVELYCIKRISDNTYDVPTSKIGVPLNFYDEEIIV